MAKNRILFSNDFVLKNENVGINTTDPQALLDVNGTLKVSGVSTFISEANFDNNVNIAGTVGIGTVVDIIPYDTLSNGTLSFEGSAGQLFSITNNLTSGSIFSVNDVSGIPSIDVDADGTIQLAPYADGNIGIATTLPTSRLHVVGDVLVTGVVTATSFSGSTNSAIYATSAGIATNVIGGVSSVTSLNVSGISTLGTVKISSGIVTATSGVVTYYGDGSNLQGVTAFYVDTQVNTSEAVYPTLASGVGVNSVGISTNKLVFIESTTRLGIGTTNPSYNLHVVGDFAATTKSFSIPHPTKQGMTLRYGSLESPYHGIRLTGSSVVENGKCIVELPDYIHKLVKEEGVNIQLTNIRHGKVLWVESIDISHNNFIVMTESVDGYYEFYWDFTAIRNDIDEMVVEY